MKTYYLSIGSNVHPDRSVPACLKKLAEKYPAVRFSTVYETDPVGPAGTQRFWNLAAALPTAESKAQLHSSLRKIEASLGRVRVLGERFAPRTIDIDVLPQEDYQSQAFIMIPLAEIAPDEVDEKTGRSFRSLAQEVCTQAVNFRVIKLALRTSP